MPYVLLFQDRTKYIHVKVVYSDHTYTLRTLPPVENSQSIPSMSRILLGIALLLLCVYFYVCERESGMCIYVYVCVWSYD